jgi:hypothetical protein
MEFVWAVQEDPEGGSSKLLQNIRDIVYSSVVIFAGWGEH